ncbi:hypothetical protein [Phenylobacterium sp.]|jgi:hypothetical protein|uniref:hypothetical protein n=1 Tax=Phenylobacterium sp. TaxID=1871053 RepID=UPI002F412903
MDDVSTRRGLILAAGVLGILGSASIIAAAFAETHVHRPAPRDSPASSQAPPPAVGPAAPVKP